MMNDEKQHLRSRRGFTTNEEDKAYLKKTSTELAALLQDKDPKVRASAAKAIGARREAGLAQAMCGRLVGEKALYAKIAICEALVKIGEPALRHLVPLLGKIGKNQHTTLPAKEFKKDSYPLPRDIAARTICRMGVKALPPLDEVIKHGELYQAREAVDAIGFISFYSKNDELLASLLALLDASRDDVLTWKILRALSAFPAAESRHVLLEYANKAELPQFRWEARRSLRSRFHGA